MLWNMNPLFKRNSVKQKKTLQVPLVYQKDPIDQIINSFPTKVDNIQTFLNQKVFDIDF